ncbi:Uncharacterized protein RNJ44_04650 [Nakaseomyces bracarensis]|uniref:Cullin family profile domain-containing protein n=1 Tax=Nakaseomyces bracarensis TaxID=273131 RepID=A0ABR4NVI3_9SACH
MSMLYHELNEYFEYAKQSLYVSESDICVSDDRLRRLQLLSPSYKDKCRYLTQRRLDSNSDDTIRDVKKLRTDGSARLYTSVKEFWKFISTELEKLTASYADEIIRSFGLDIKGAPELERQKYRRLNSSMKVIITKLKCLLLATSTVAEYTFLNYPKLMRSICKQYSALDYAFYAFITHLKERLGKSLKGILEESIETLDTNLLNVNKLHFDTEFSLFSLLSFYDLEITEGYPVVQFLEDHINREIKVLMNSEVDEAFLETVYMGARKEILLSKLCHSEVTTSRYLQILLSEDIFIKVLEYILEKYENLLEKSSENIELRKDDIHYSLKRFYCNNGQVENYYLYIKHFLHKRLAFAKVSKSSLENVFVEATNLSILFYFDRKILKILMDELSACYHGTLQMYESFEKLLELKIRKYNKSHEKAIESGLNYNIRDDLMKNRFHDRCLFLLPSALKFESSFLKLHQQKLFRRAIMQGPEIYETISDFSYLEMNVMYTLISMYEKTDEMHGLYDLYLSLRRSYLFCQDYKKKEDQDVVPLIIDKRNVPVVFQKEPNEDLILPQQLQEQWENLHNFFYSNTSSADVKSLVPIYSLQHCDVVTPFSNINSNGEKLILNLSIYQTCVLNLFNDKDDLAIEQICEKTGLKLDTVLQVLESFEAPKLITKSDSRYHINMQFQADPKKIKDGKLRIPMVVSHKKGNVRRSTPPTSSTETSSTDTRRPHSEGYSSLWRQELIKAAIVRNLKLNELTRDELYQLLLPHGTSIGEFNDALQKLVSDKIIESTSTGFKY